MAEVAERGFKETSNFIKTWLELMEAFFKTLGDKLESDAKTSSQRAMAKWLMARQFNPDACTLYDIQGDGDGSCIDEVTRELDKAGIPYFRTTDKSRLIIRNVEEDFEAVKDINRKVLVARCNYFQEADLDEYENAIATIDKVKNKDLVKVEGISSLERYVIETKANRVARGLTIGEKKKDDGKYTLGIHAPSVYREGKADFCKAFLQAQLSLYGPNAKDKRKEIQADMKLEADVADLKGKEGVHYIIGVDDPSQYIEINGDEFEYYDKPGKGPAIQVSVDDPDYDYTLRKCMNGIYNKQIIDNMEELSKHLSTKERTVETNRPKQTKEAYYKRLATDEIADIIDKMVSEKMDEYLKDHKDLAASEKFEVYRSEAATIVTALCEERYVEGYDNEKMNDMLKVLRKYDIEPSTYSNVATMLESKGVKQEKATKKMRTRIEEREVHRQHATKHTEREDQEI